MTASLHGGCHCGRIALDVVLSKPASEYTPRACDCSFCRKHGAAWLSDAGGSLRVRLRGEPVVYRQGSAQADFIACAHCAVLVLVRHEHEGRVHAAVNVRALAGAAPFADEQPASPQKLAPQEKRERWTTLWFADVRIVDADD
ncbi:GFA family protein [Lysobacter arvi]|uniref:Aldehyde-activating protein n=1 Tax=Lysobacter arvi TaxID=3038776 RepID=A0ABU1CHW5_9GAMM|nr:aldehyde-activating protein [Lysobacter arvi]MDR0184531.1 aldehyde-activating protein [Lysobacter arvi]